MTTATDVATLFLSDIGAPASVGNVRAVTVWLNAENSDPTLRNNPWNLHSWGGLPGQVGSANVGPGDQNVAVFGTIGAGVAANARNLTALASTYPQYGQAIDALRSNNPTGFLSAIAASPWSAGHYRVNGQNSLLTAYNGSGNVPAAGTAVSATGHVSGAGTTLSGPALAAFQQALNESLGVGSGPVASRAVPSGGGVGGFATVHPVVFALVAAAAIALVIGQS